MSPRSPFKFTLLMGLLAVIFSSLGLWQLERKSEKAALFEAFANAPQMSLGDAVAAEQPFAQVRATGHYDSQRHFLLDNKIYEAQAGVHVLTPFTTLEGQVLLVNRGWKPLPPDRSTLPTISTPDIELPLYGRLNAPPQSGPKLGASDQLGEDQWPQLMTYFDLPAIETALQKELLPWIVLLDADQPHGFVGRDWKPATMRPEMHGAYAFQWFALTAAAVLIWGLRMFRPRRNADKA